jgi:ATP-dependent Lon protease
MAPSSAEGTVVRTYLDWILALPWTRESKDKIDIAKAETILEEDHYGLVKVRKGFLNFCPSAN